MQGWGLWVRQWRASSHLRSHSASMGRWWLRFRPLTCNCPCLLRSGSLPSHTPSSPHPFSHSVPWRDRLYEALTALGAADTADSCSKYIQRQDYKEHK